MFYGFISEEIKQINKRDPLYLQAQYAKYINSYCELNMRKNVITTQQGNILSMKGKEVMLRCTCDNINQAINMYTKYGAVLVENQKDIMTIEEWYKYNICNREIIEINYEVLLYSLEKNIQLIELLNSCPIVFIKSKHKGFSCLVPSVVILNKEEFFIQFLKRQCNNFGEKLVISKFLNIRQDSLGKRESRHVVLHKKIINSSRQISSLIHNVPKSHLSIAEQKVKIIQSIEKFPENYILDLGEYILGDKNVVDIIEINPITTALCYINNSIYEGESNEMGMGLEYYYDYLNNPYKYFTRRVSNRKYTYMSDSFYDFT